MYKGRFLGQDVAIKRPIIATTADLQRFRQEVTVLSEVRHENIVHLVGKVAGAVRMLAMRQLRGRCRGSGRV